MERERRNERGLKRNRRKGEKEGVRRVWKEKDVTEREYLERGKMEKETKESEGRGTRWKWS